MVNHAQGGAQEAEQMSHTPRQRYDTISFPRDEGADIKAFRTWFDEYQGIIERISQRAWPRT
jgi:hypothetical protein